MTLRVSFKYRILIATILVVVCTLAVTGLFLNRQLREQHLDQARESLFSQIVLIREIMSRQLSSDMTPDQNDRLAKNLSSRLDYRITLINPSGEVIGDSELPLDEVRRMENHADRPEVMEALKNGRGWSLRRSGTLGEDLLYAAERIDFPEKSVLVVRIAKPLTELAKDIERLNKLILWACLWGVLLSIAMAFIVAHQMSRPLRELTRAALDISSGNFRRRHKIYPKHEIGDLGRAFDRMTDHLQEEIAAVTQARDRLEAVLRGMVEGVLVTDENGRITQINYALKTMLGLDSQPIGRMISEIVRNPNLIDAVRRVSERRINDSLEIRVLGPKPRTLQVEAAALPGGGHKAGVVAVFHDITERKLLEETRRDFVANVSHELRTPLAAVKGAVETLLDGALNDPKYSKQFTEVIERHVRRLEGTVMDLLDLARLESFSDKPKNEVVSVQALVETALAAVSEMAAARQITVESRSIEEPVQFKGSPRQIEHALVNLLDNAIKYTNPGGSVLLEVSVNAGLVRFDVTDTGIGIPSDHLSRIFERFYRVDKNRSREVGGTGLGLSIVKHVAQVHSGQVEVVSTPGKGSTFSLILPIQS